MKYFWYMWKLPMFGEQSVDVVLQVSFIFVANESFNTKNTPR